MTVNPFIALICIIVALVWVTIATRQPDYQIYEFDSDEEL